MIFITLPQAESTTNKFPDTSKDKPTGVSNLVDEPNTEQLLVQAEPYGVVIVAVTDIPNPRVPTTLRMMLGYSSEKYKLSEESKARFALAVMAVDVANPDAKT